MNFAGCLTIESFGTFYCIVGLFVLPCFCFFFLDHLALFLFVRGLRAFYCLGSFRFIPLIHVQLSLSTKKKTKKENLSLVVMSCHY